MDCNEKKQCEPGGTLYEALNGNGKVGIKTRMELIDMRLKRIEKVAGAILFCVILALVGALLNLVLNNQQKDHRSENSSIVEPEHRIAREEVTW